MLDARAICETCGHTRDWHDHDAARARLGTDPPVERPCYREVGGAPCRCGGFRGSGAVAVPAGSGAMRGPAAPGVEIIRVAAIVLLLVVLLVVLGLGLLYAYRSQAPSVPEVDISTAIQDINAGRVRVVTFDGNKATLEFRDAPGHMEQTTVPLPDNILSPAIASYNAAHPSQPTSISLRYTQQGQPFGLVGAILLSLLPVFLIGGFFYYTMRGRRGP